MKLIMITAISAAVIFTALTTHSLLAANENIQQKEELERLQSSIEQGLRNIVPSTAIMAFYSKECPTGWIIADGTKNTPDLRGEFIRGWDRGRGVDKFYELDEKLNATAKERPLGSWQAPTLITTAIGPDGLQQGVIEGSEENAAWDDFYSGMQADWIKDAWYSNAFKGMIYGGIPGGVYKEAKNRKGLENIYTDPHHSRPINSNPHFVSGGTRPRNVALLYCMKE